MTFTFVKLGSLAMISGNNCSGLRLSSLAVVLKLKDLEGADGGVHCVTRIVLSLLCFGFALFVLASILSKRFVCVCLTVMRSEIGLQCDSL